MSLTEPSPARQRWIAARPWITLAARLGLGGVLLYAGLIKIVDLRQSVVAVRAYEFPISDSLVSLIGHGLPIVEILLGLVIIAGLFTRLSAELGGAMMVVYIAAISSAWARGLAIDCGCLTPGGLLLTDDQKTEYLQDILRDVALIACAVWLIIFPRCRFSLDSWMHTPPSEGAAADGTE